MKRFRFSGRAAVVCSLILAVGIPATAVGFGEGRSLLAGKRNPGYPHALSAETQIIADNATYGTRQSNLRTGDGGGAIYGCRSAPGKEPCIRANNLNTGRAFEFATDGKEGGRITTQDATGAPFTTNATGVATGLNADRVDGKDATDFAAAGDLLFASVLDSTSAAPTATGRGVTPTVAKTTDTGGRTVFTVTFNKDVSKCSYTASPVGAAAATAPGVAPVSGTPAAVAVNVGVPTGNPYSFHLQVIC
jgi:hypothetical protein